MDDAEELEEITGGAEEKMVNEDDLPPGGFFMREDRIPVREEPTEPEYLDAPKPYRGFYDDDEPEDPEDEPDYED